MRPRSEHGTGLGSRPHTRTEAERYGSLILAMNTSCAIRRALHGLFVLSPSLALAEPFFSVHSSLTVGTNPIAIVAAEMNADGRVDLVVANGGEKTISILTNQGQGQFDLAVKIPLSGQPTSRSSRM